MLKRRLLPLSLLAIVFALPVAPQQRPKANTQAERQAQTSAPQSAGTENAAKNEESGNEANPNDVFRHSDSVKLVSRITGLSLDTAYWLCIVLNFIVVFAILWILLRKALPTVFRNRSEVIQRRLEEARKASEEARVRLTAVEERLSRLDVEIEDMRRESESAAHADEERVMASAEEERRRIVESAQEEIARSASAARRELKAYVAELAVDLAGKQIHLTESTDEKLVRHFAARLGKDGN